MPTIADVAKRAGVSLSTASDILNGKLKATPATADRVRQAVLELNYRPNVLARRLRTSKADAVGLVIPFRRSIFSTAILTDFLAGIQAEQERLGLNLVLAGKRYDKPGAVLGADLFESRAVDGLILIGTRETEKRDLDADVRSLRKLGCPFVCLHTFHCREPVDRITRAGSDPWQDVLEHLAERGHRRIGRITFGYEFKLAPPQPAAALARAIAPLGLETRPEWTGAGEAFDGSAMRAAMEILKHPNGDRPTALICDGDELAIAALQASLSLGLKVPGDVAIASTVNHSVGATAAVPITTHGAPSAMLGRMALKRLAELIADSSLPPRETAVPGQLIVRAST